MTKSRLWILPLLTLMLLMPAACNKDDSEGGSGQGEEQVRVPRRVAPPQNTAVCDGVCFTALPSVGTNPRLAPRTLRYEDDDYLGIRNVTDQTVSFDGWFISTGEASAALPSGINVAPRETFRFHLGQAGTNDSANAYLADSALSLEAVGEVALFSAEDFSVAENIKLYLRWGAAPAGASHVEPAHQAELWHRDVFIPVCDGDVGIVAVGNIAIPRGYRSQTYECFERVR